MRTAVRVALVAAALPLGASAPGSGEDGQTTLTDEFDAKGDGGRLEATFRPDGEGRWRVVFDFVFQGIEGRFAGTAEGSLTQGELRGRAQDSNTDRTFTFRGRFEDGVFRGTHAEIEGDRPVPTGSLTLRG